MAEWSFYFNDFIVGPKNGPLQPSPPARPGLASDGVEAVLKPGNGTPIKAWSMMILQPIKSFKQPKFAVYTKMAKHVFKFQPNTTCSPR